MKELELSLCGSPIKIIVSKAFPKNYISFSPTISESEKDLIAFFEKLDEYLISSKENIFR